MIAASRWMAGVALALALGVHGAGLMRLDLTHEVQIEGGQAGALQASLGDAFADMAQGTMTATQTTDLTEPVPVTEASQEVLPDVTPALTPDVTPALTRAQTPALTAARAPQTLDPLEPVAALSDADLAPTPALPVTQPTTTNTPVPPSETIAADAPAQLEVTQSMRPKLRSRAFEARNTPVDPPPAPKPVRRADPAPAAPATRGNQAQTNARAGQADGAAKAPSAQRATGNQQSVSAGNAAVSNYPGKVVRRIQQVRRPRIKDVGAPAVVTFRIAANGRLSSVSIRRSSGSADLDRAAIQTIQRAAPFPPPPPGAQRSFNMPIIGG